MSDKENIIPQVQVQANQPRNARSLLKPGFRTARSTATQPQTSIQDQLREEKEKVIKWQAKFRQQKELFEQYYSSFATLTQQNRDLRQENEGLKSQVSDQSGVSAQDLRVLEQSNRELRARQVELEALLEQQVEAHERDCALLRDAQTEARTTPEKVSVPCAPMPLPELEGSSEELRQHVEALSLRYELLRSECESLKTSLTTRDQACKEAQARALDLSQKLCRADSELKGRQDLLTRTQQSLEQLQGTHAELQTKFETAVQQRVDETEESLKDEIVRLKERLSAAQLSSVDQDRSVDGLREQLQAAQDLTEQHKQKTREQAQYIKDLQADLVRLNKQHCQKLNELSNEYHQEEYKRRYADACVEATQLRNQRDRLLKLVKRLTAIDADQQRTQELLQARTAANEALDTQLSRQQAELRAEQSSLTQSLHDAEQRRGAHEAHSAMLCADLEAHHVRLAGDKAQSQTESEAQVHRLQALCELQQRSGESLQAEHRELLETHAEKLRAWAAERNELTHARAELRAQADGLRSQLTEEQTKRDACLGQCRELLEHATRTCDHLRTERNDFKRQCAQLHDTLSLRDTALTRVQQQSTELSHMASADLSLHIHMHREQVLALRQTIDELTNQLVAERAHSADQISAAEQERTRLVEQLVLLRLTCARQAMQLEDSLATALRAGERSTAALQLHADTTSILESKCLAQATEIARLSVLVQHTESRALTAHDQSSMHREDLTAQLQAARCQATRRGEENSSLREEMGRMQEEHSELLVFLQAEQQERLGELSGSLADAARRDEAASQRQTELEQSLELRAQEIAQLTRTLHTTHQELQTHTQTLESLQSQHNLKVQEHTHTVSQLDHTQTQLEECQARVTALESTLKEREDQMSQDAACLEQMMAQRDEALQSLQSAEQSREEMRRQKEQLMIQLEAMLDANDRSTDTPHAHAHPHAHLHTHPSSLLPASPAPSNYSEASSFGTPASSLLGTPSPSPQRSVSMLDSPAPGGPESSFLSEATPSSQHSVGLGGGGGGEGETPLCSPPCEEGEFPFPSSPLTSPAEHSWMSSLPQGNEPRSRLSLGPYDPMKLDRVRTALRMSQAPHELSRVLPDCEEQ